MGQMNHLSESELELFLLDGELDENRSRKIERHLAECVTCRKKLAELILLRDLLRDTEAGELSPVAQSMIERIRKEFTSDEIK
ncbi:MAG TPA: hypothetical protein ENJ23_03585 [Bacteroidetes bacterium]|nr:hypothetical protein [Bacteroidota bacterium]